MFDGELVASSRETAAHDEVRGSLRTGATSLGMSAGSCDSVGVEEDHDLSGNEREARPDRRALAATGIPFHAGPGRAGDLGRAVLRVAVHDEHLVDVRADGLDERADRSFFVSSKDDGRQALPDRAGRGG